MDHTVQPTASPYADDRAGSPVTIYYRLQGSREMPVLNCSKTVKSVLLASHPNILRAFNTWTSRWRKVILLMFAVGSVLSWLFPFLDVHTAKGVAVAMSLLQAVPLSISLLNLRYDLAKLVFATYEFAYVTTIIAITMAVTVPYLQDVRCMLVISTSMNYINALMADANFTSVRVVAIATSFGAVALVVYVVYVGFDMLDGATNVVLVQYEHRVSVETKDIIVNGLAMVLVVIVRNAYRRQTSVVSQSRDEVIVRCVSLRTRIKLEPVATPDAQLPPAQPNVESRTSITESTTTPPLTTPLELTPDPTIFDASQVFSSYCGRHMCDTNPKWRGAFRLLGWIAFALTATSFGLREGTVLNRVCSTAASTTTVLYCGVCFAHSSKQLLRRLSLSFDFLFFEIQVLLGHLTLCHLFLWDLRCLVVVSLTIWVRWVLTLDSLTPVAKEKLGISMRLAGCVLFTEGVGLLVLLWELTAGMLKQVDDRLLMTIRLPGDRTLSVGAIAFLVTRSFTIFWWCWRLLWRLYHRRENELLMIQGVVQYNDYQLQKRLRGARRRQKPPRARSLFVPGSMNPPHGIVPLSS